MSLNKTVLRGCVTNQDPQGKWWCDPDKGKAFWFTKEQFRGAVALKPGLRVVKTIVGRETESVVPEFAYKGVSNTLAAKTSVKRVAHVDEDFDVYTDTTTKFNKSTNVTFPKLLDVTVVVSKTGMDVCLLRFEAPSSIHPFEPNSCTLRLTCAHGTAQEFLQKQFGVSPAIMRTVRG